MATHLLYNAKEALFNTADTLLLINREGVCIDIINSKKLDFIHENEIINNNMFLNISNNNLIIDIQKTIENQTKTSGVYDLKINNYFYTFTIINQPYQEHALVQLHYIKKQNKPYYTADYSKNINISNLNQFINDTIHFIDFIPFSIIVKDVENEFNHIIRNKEAYNRNYVNSTAPLNTNDYLFYPEDIAKQEWNEDIEIAKNKSTKKYIYESKNANNDSIIVEKQKIYIEGTSKIPDVILCLEKDITLSEREKRTLELDREKEIKSNKLKSNFLANISHEIRTPLNVIIGFTKLINESRNEYSEEEISEYINIIEANNEKLLNLINDILDISKIESGHLNFNYTRIDANELFTSLYNSYRLNKPEGINFIYDKPSEELIIISDKTRLSQVLSNLISNALKFTPKGEVHFGYRYENKALICYVKDTGIGLKPEEIEEIFKRFSRINPFIEGTGLGLTISNKIVKLLGGNIFVESEVDKGTTFTIKIPMKYEKKAIKIGVRKNKE